MKRLWTRFRALPTVAQVLIGIAVTVIVIAASLSDTAEEKRASSSSEPTTTTTTVDTPAPSTTLSRPTTTLEVWTYTASDGKTYRVENDDDTDFTDGKPGPVGMIDLAAGRPSPCDAVRSERDFWRDYSLGGESGQNAKAYVAYANDVLKRLGC